MLNPRTIDAKIRTATSETMLIDDTGERGTGRLALRIRPSAGGARAEWVAVWWRDGKRRIGVMGRYPDLALTAARDLFARDWRPQIAAGLDPRQCRPSASSAGTVADLFAEYVQSMKERGCRSWPQVQASLLTGRRCAAAALGRETRAADVRPEAVAAFLARVYQRGARTAADRYRAHLHAAFRWGARSAHDYTRAAADAGPRTQFGITANPVAPIPRDTGANRARDRSLTTGELRSLWHAAGGPGFSLLTGPAIRLLICTGQRVTDVLRARGDHFDLDAALWTIPGDLRKVNAGDHVVPLPPQAMAIVRELVSVRGSGLLFPCQSRPAEPVPHQTINRALARWNDGDPFQARDLRRTWKTQAGAAGIDKTMRDRIQGHAMTDVASVHYDRHDYLREKRAAMATWAAWLDGILSDVVVPIRGTARV